MAAPRTNLKMAEFLNLYFRQLHFDKMPIEKRATFDNYRKNNNDFNGNMKSWNSDLLDNDGKNMELLDITDNAVITEDEVKKIFKLFVDTLQSMDANKDRYKDEKKVNSFLDEYFGQNKLFTPSVASPEGEAAMAKVLNILEKNQNMSVLLSTWGVLDSEFTFENLKKAIKDQEYNNDTKIRKKVGKVIEYISYYLPTPGGINTGDQNLDAINKSMPAAEQLNQNDFANQKTWYEATINSHKLDYFKSNYQTIFNDLYSKDKLRDAFRDNGGSKFTEQIDNAISKTDYSNEQSKDFLIDTEKDQLNFKQKVKRWADNTYENYLDKYVTLSGDRMYFSNSARMIVKALDSAKMKPTDGLDKVLSAAGDIEKGLKYKSPTATKHFGYMKKTLETIKANFPKMFEGALRNGKQMRALISKLIIDAVRNDKMDEAKTMMEVLAVIKYGYTTGNILDTMKANPLNIFSDASHPWNKGNDAVQFITGAMDKTINFAIRSATLGLTVGVNAIRRSQSKLNGQTGRMGKEYKNYTKDKKEKLQNATKKLTDTQNEKTTAQTNQSTHQAEANTQDANYTTELNNLKATFPGLSDNIINKMLELDPNARENYLEKMSQNVIGLDRFENDPAILTLRQDIGDMEPTITPAVIDALINEPDEATRLNTLMNPPHDMKSLDAQTIDDDIKKLIEHGKKTKEYKDDFFPQFGIDEDDYQNLASTPINLSEIPRITAEIESLKTIDQEKKAAQNKYKDATDYVDMLNDQIKEQKKDVDKLTKDQSDKFRELMAYWDYVNNRRKMNKWLPLSRELQQDKFMKDNSAANINLQNYTASYRSVA